MNAIGPAFIGGVPGGMELVVILLIVVLLFGANKLPKLARSSGEAIGEFRKGREEIETEIREGMNEGAGTAGSEEAPETTEPTPETTEPA